jgi:hypothetical protein
MQTETEQTPGNETYGQERWTTERDIYAACAELNDQVVQLSQENEDLKVRVATFDHDWAQRNDAFKDTLRRATRDRDDTIELQAEEIAFYKGIVRKGQTIAPGTKDESGNTFAFVVSVMAVIVSVMALISSTS